MPDNLATDLGITGEFGLYEGGDTVLIDKEMIHPPRVRTFAARLHSRFPPDKQPPTGVVRVDLVGVAEVFCEICSLHIATSHLVNNLLVLGVAE